MPDSNIKVMNMPGGDTVIMAWLPPLVVEAIKNLPEGSWGQLSLQVLKKEEEDVYLLGNEHLLRVSHGEKPPQQ